MLSPRPSGTVQQPSDAAVPQSNAADVADRKSNRCGYHRWEGDLFRGQPDWQKLHSYPAPQLTAEEQAFLDGPAEEACRMANDFEITHELADLPPELWQFLREHKFFAMIIRKEYGGLAFSAYAQARVLQNSPEFPVFWRLPSAFLTHWGGELLQHYGTDEQKNAGCRDWPPGRKSPALP